MTLREIRARWPHLFYEQDWFKGEAFMDTEAETVDPPIAIVSGIDSLGPGVTAADLALAYVREPEAHVWDRYLWTSDKDRHGQRVYVGGVSNTGGFEIHRHLHLTERWGVPVW